VVLNGPDGKIVVDTFLLPAWPKLKETLDGLGNAPLKTVIDTHWHFDHTDNNGNLHAATNEIAAGKPLADLDPVWGHGMLSSDFFVQMVYSPR
jgi:glyoxylase-like metal-dependent hydrolase (beta-lactamase superfamily II)